MLKRLIAMAILALTLSSVNAIEIPWPTCLPCDDPPPQNSGGGN